MYVYSDEDNATMKDDYQIEYTGVINDRLFRQTGECVVMPAREEENETVTNGTRYSKHDRR